MENRSVDLYLYRHCAPSTLTVLPYSWASLHRILPIMWTNRHQLPSTGTPTVANMPPSDRLMQKAHPRLPAAATQQGRPGRRRETCCCNGSW